MEPSSPVAEKMWKPELYKIQLEAPTPKPLQCALPRPKNDKIPNSYEAEYFGELNHTQAEQLLSKTPDGTYLLRRSPKAEEYFTLSVRFNNRTKHFKIYYKSDKGHYLQEQSKHYDTISELVADGLVNFYMQLHAAPIIQQINQQSRSCFSCSPYMTLNRRKLHALSHELCKNITFQDDNKINADKNSSVELSTATINNNSHNNINNNLLISKETDETDTDPILPIVYEKKHLFKVHTFKGLNWCEFCANFLWGFTAQGMKCETCGFMAHSKCSELVPPKCVPDLKHIRGVFGTDLTTLVTLYNCTIPFVVRRCVEEIEARGMLHEGIYRVSGFADEIDALKLSLDREGEKTDMSETAYGNVNVIAGTLKLYLRLLPIPLITFQAYPYFMEAAKNRNLEILLKNMSTSVKKLPLAHYNCLKFMMEHLKRVASHFAVNKMNEHNLATVFAPTLIATPQFMTNLTEEILMLSSLITHCETIFV